MKKLISLVLALAMVLLCVGVAMAANTAKTIASGQGGSGSITIQDANPDQSYGFYKIFDATPNEDGTSVSYKFIGTAPAAGNAFYTYFSIDTAGNISITDAGKDSTDATKLSNAAVSYLNANYTTLGTLIYTANPGHDGLAEGSKAYDLTVTGLPYGYYYITSTTGTTVSVDTVQPNATTKEKNPGTEIDKSITGVADGSVKTSKDEALAQVGTVVSYDVRIPIVNGARNYSFTDKMGHGLTLDPDSVKVYLVNEGAAVASGATAETAGTADASQFGTLTAANKETDGQEDISIAFNQAWLTANVGKDIIVVYSATVNTSALIADHDGNPNEATIKWGDDSSYLTDHDDAKVYSAKVVVKKIDGNKQPLEGAGFKLYKTVTVENVETKQYYKYDTTNGVTWTTEANATEIFPKRTHTNEGAEDDVISGDAVAEFLGLANGTYTLTESTVPDGFNKAADVSFSIKDANASDLDLDLTIPETVTNNQGTELPSTGGIGTTIFYILGGLLVIGAAVILVARRKAQD